MKHKGFLSILIVVFLGIICYFIYQMDFSSLGLTFTNNQLIAVIIIMLVLVIVFYVVSYIYGRQKSRALHYRDQLFNALTKNSNTIYLMCEGDTKEIIYRTENIIEVLGVAKENNEQNSKELIKNFFDLPFVQNELRSWDGKSEFVSQMISYRNPGYQQVRWMKLKMYPFKDKKNDYVVMVLSDATKEHDQQHLLVAQASDIKTREQQLNQITAMAYDIEWDINVTTGEFVSHNLKEGINYFGEDQNGTMKKDFAFLVQDYIALEDQKNVLEQLSIENLNVLADKNNNEPYSVRYRLEHPKETVWLESTVFFTRSRGEIHATILTKNVTEDAEYMRRQNILLENALKEAKQANKSKSDFLTVVSHEIRTPMNAMIGMSESALREELSKPLREDLENIHSASKNLVAVIDNILDISKMEAGKMTLDEKEYEVPKLFLDIAAITNSWIGDKKIKLNLDIDSNLPKVLFGDRSKIHQIILNLMSNAVKYTETGSITLKASSELVNDKAYLTISVIDTGKGMNEKKLEKLFTADAESGMGLMITKKFINLLNGELSAKSEVGVGSTFTVLIKQRIIDETRIGYFDQYKIEVKKADSFDASDKRILIVDDDKLNLKVASRLLKPYQVTVIPVNSGEECLEVLKNESFDLILLDQMMPNMSGTETLNHLRQMNIKTPVVVLTADAIVGMKDKYLENGFNDYLSKPIDTKELYQVLKKYLKKQI